MGYTFQPTTEPNRDGSFSWIALCAVCRSGVQLWVDRTLKAGTDHEAEVLLYEIVVIVCNNVACPSAGAWR